MAPLISSLELGGGVLLAAGLASRLIAFLLTCNMMVAFITGDREALFAIFSDPDKLLDRRFTRWLLLDPKAAAREIRATLPNSFYGSPQGERAALLPQADPEVRRQVEILWFSRARPALKKRGAGSSYCQRRGTSSAHASFSAWLEMMHGARKLPAQGTESLP